MFSCANLDIAPVATYPKPVKRESHAAAGVDLLWVEAHAAYRNGSSSYWGLVTRVFAHLWNSDLVPCLKVEDRRMV